MWACHADTHIMGMGVIAYPKDVPPIPLGFMDYRGVPCEGPEGELV